MAERLKAHAWKACIRVPVSWVRIPLPPPSLTSELSPATPGTAETSRFRAGLGRRPLTARPAIRPDSSLSRPIFSATVDYAHSGRDFRPQKFQWVSGIRNSRSSNVVRPGGRYRVPIRALNSLGFSDAPIRPIDPRGCACPGRLVGSHRSGLAEGRHRIEYSARMGRYLTPTSPGPTQARGRIGPTS